MKVFTLTETHAEAMAALHTLGFDPAWPAEDMREHIARDIVIGIGEPLAGFVIVRAAGDQAEILTIIVDPARRGKGKGQSLLAAAETEAFRQGADIMFLEVAEDNAAAIQLYRLGGYLQIGRRPAYYRRAGGRVSALTFRKNLDAARPTD